MCRNLFMLSACLALCAAAAAADDKDAKKDDRTKASKVSVQPLDLSVHRKQDEKLFGYSSPGTQVTVLARLPGHTVLSIDPQASKVAVFKDDKGTSLLSTGFVQSNFSLYRLAVDRSALVAGVAGNKTPAPGATRVHLKGDMVVVCGKEEKTTDELKFEFKDKAEAKSGDFTVKVTQEKGFGTNGASFAVLAKKNVIKGVTVKDDAGMPVELFTGYAGGFGNEWSANFILRKPLKQGKVTVTYFSKEEKVTVPVDVTVGVGLVE